MLALVKQSRILD